MFKGLLKYYILIIGLVIFTAACGAFADVLPLVLKIDGLTNPCGVDVAPNGDIYIADTGANVIKKYNSSGSLLSTYGADLGLRNPEGIAVSAEGTMYIADTGNNRVLKLKPDGAIDATFGANNEYWQIISIFLAM
jgi:DNA-binding beta-propeller fold protein YncE